MSYNINLCRYDPLCSQLNEKSLLKKQLKENLKACIEEERRIMSETIAIVNSRKLDDSKLTRKMASLQLEALRGFNLGPDSTYRQTKNISGHDGPSASFLPPLITALGNKTLTKGISSNN